MEKPIIWKNLSEEEKKNIIYMYIFRYYNNKIFDLKDFIKIYNFIRENLEDVCCYIYNMKFFGFSNNKYLIEKILDNRISELKCEWPDGIDKDDVVNEIINNIIDENNYQMFNL